MNKRDFVIIRNEASYDIGRIIEWCFTLETEISLKEEYIFISLYQTGNKYSYKYYWESLESLNGK